jgi:hypothetical protein
MHGYSAAAEYRRRQDTWLAGDLEALLTLPHPRRTRIIPEDKRKFFRAASLAGDGLFRKARQTLQSYGTAPPDQLTIDKLVELHPPRKFPADIDRPRSEPLPISHKELERIFTRMPRRSSTHRDGWRWEHLKTLCESNVAVGNSFIAWTQLLLAGDLPAQVLDYLRSSTLIAFNKLSQEERAKLAHWERKIRPIAIGSVLLRAALSLVILLVRDPLTRHLVRAHQLVFGFASACDAATHALHASLQLHPDWSMFVADIFNAFNELSRTAIWQALSTVPALAPLLPVTHWLYMAAPSELWYYNPAETAGPPIATILSQEGTRQGCVLGASSLLSRSSRSSTRLRALPRRTLPFWRSRTTCAWWALLRRWHTRWTGFLDFFTPSACVWSLRSVRCWCLLASLQMTSPLRCWPSLSSLDYLHWECLSRLELRQTVIFL